MTAEQIEVIRARNQARRAHDTPDGPSWSKAADDRDYSSGKCDDDWDREHVEFWLSAIADIDMLLAGVDQLGTSLEFWQRSWPSLADFLLTLNPPEDVMKLPAVEAAIEMLRRQHAEIERLTALTGSRPSDNPDAGGMYCNNCGEYR